MAEVYAGFLSHADHQIGRLLDYLDDIGERENTLVVVVSDNGASGEGGPNGSVNEMKFVNGIPDDMADNLAHARRARRPADVQPLPERLGDGVQHPVQDVEALRVQRRHLPTRASSRWPAGIERPRRDPRAVPPRRRHRADHPRLLGVEAPTHDQGPRAEPLRRGEHALLARRRRGADQRRTQFYSMLGSRAIWHDGWKAITTHPTLSGWSHFNDDEWELYHTDVDRAELHNLAAEQPEKLRELVNLWFAEAGAQPGVPARRPSAFEIFMTPRPLLAPPRDRYVYFPGHRGGARVAVGQHPQPLVRDRRAGRPARARRGRACCSPRARGSAATPSTSRTTGSTT